jgi:erythronate-4-phosphate dehydrogenase
MIDADRLALMRPDAYLVNTSRGGVVDSRALIATLERGSIGGAVLDVFEGEPEPPPALISLPELATPHVAGYAIEGKRRGAIVIYQGICRVFDVEPRPTDELLLAGFDPPDGEVVEFALAPDDALAADNALRALLAATHGIGALSTELKATLGEDERGTLFDRMRRDYERDYGRHELAVYRVGLAASVGHGLRREVARRLHGFGVTVTDESPHYVLAPAIQSPSAGQPT